MLQLILCTLIIIKKFRFIFSIFSAFRILFLALHCLLYLVKLLGKSLGFRKLTKNDTKDYNENISAYLVILFQLDTAEKSSLVICATASKFSKSLIQWINWIQSPIPYFLSNSFWNNYVNYAMLKLKRRSNLKIDPVAWVIYYHSIRTNWN